jgi:hypothetical protein
MANTGAIRTVWTAVGAIVFYFSLNALARAWQWPLALPGIAFEKTTDPYAAALIAVPTCLSLLSVLFTLGASHSARVKRPNLLLRIPRPFGLADPWNRPLHVVQLVLFVLFPLISVATLTRKVFSGQFCVRDASAIQGCGVGGVKVIGNWGEHFRYMSVSQAIGAHIYVYQGGVEYWPFWMPLVICLLWVAAICALAVFVRNLMRRE